LRDLQAALRKETFGFHHLAGLHAADCCAASPSASAGTSHWTWRCIPASCCIELWRNLNATLANPAGV